jgi:hypothetical protein
VSLGEVMADEVGHLLLGSAGPEQVLRPRGHDAVVPETRSSSGGSIATDDSRTFVIDLEADCHPLAGGCQAAITGFAQGTLRATGVR